MRATHRHARAADYRRPGGPWDTTDLDTALQPARDERVEDGVARLAGGLRAAGVRRGHVVSWQLPNRWEATALYRACWRIGAVAAPVHHLAGEAEVAAMRSQVAPVFVVDGERLPSLLRCDPVRRGAFSVRPADVAVVLFTSGSSGTPKGVIHTHRGLTYKATLMARVHRLTRDDAILMPAPLAHISGLLNGVLVPGVTGMRTLLQERWDPDEALAIIERERVTFMIGPPTFFVGLRGAASFSAERVESLRLLSCGGAGVTPGFVADTAAALDATVKRTYGSTEAPTVTTAHAGDPADRARETDGRPTGAVEVRIADDGEVRLRGPELFAGYTDPSRNRGAFAHGGWFRTGDRGVLEDGWLTITGRLKDIIIRGGENIAVAEVEATCEAHPSVAHAVAVGAPDERMGERVAVFVVTSPGQDFDLDECRRWFAARGVARFKTPERVEVLESMPTLAAGKPDRDALRRLL
jgi:cyclohexanecarboxylate-CoA ligase